MMGTNKFTIGYSSDHLNIHHNDSTRFIVTLKDDDTNVLKQFKDIPQSKIEWIDTIEYSEMLFANLSIQAIKEHEEATRNDIPKAAKCLNNG